MQENKNTISDQVLIEAMHSVERVILALIAGQRPSRNKAEVKT